MIRCVGIADRDPSVVERFCGRAAARGLATVSAATVAVAYDDSSVPCIGVAHHDDGSFVVLDGEAFPVAQPDVMAARLLTALRSGTIAEQPFEGAITWWDARGGHAVVRGDHIGAVPVAVGRAGTSTLWSIDTADLVNAGVAPVPDPDAIALLAALGWVPAPISYLRDAEAIPAGRMMTITPGRAPVRDTWFHHTANPPTPGDAEAQADVIGAALVDAVRARAGGRLGAFLSAGIDSAAIVTVLRRELDLPVQTFTFRYLGYEGEHNEDEFAAETARILGAPHTTISVAPEELRDRFSDMVRTYGSPIGFGVHSFKQDEVRAAGIEVMLTGADPGGWQGYGRSGAIASQLWRVPARRRLALQRAAHRFESLPGAEALYWTALLANHGIKNEYATLALRRELVGAAADRATLRYADALGKLAHDYAGEAAEHRPTFVSQTVGLYDAEWNTRWGRAYGYPIRAPFYDPALALAVDRRRPWDHDKAPLRRYTARRLPHERAYAPKLYQEVPLAQWLRGPLLDFVRDATSRERVERAGIVAYEPLRRMVDEHVGGVDRKWPLWQLLTAIEWALQLQEPRETLL
ncbi:MAG TPA: asparagine synthase-related protein [Acidimicrobiales bacterium]|nr:asparagine synthase-related protein [Acidimicrobiales bacterium]